jgi:hypothetical protein
MVIRMVSVSDLSAIPDGRKSSRLTPDFLADSTARGSGHRQLIRRIRVQGVYCYDNWNCGRLYEAFIGAVLCRLNPCFYAK